jgi:hypothetical protein
MMRHTFIFSSLLLLSWAGECAAEQALAPVVIAEETIAVCEPANNGSGPLWCYGSPLVFRNGEKVYASIMETGQGVPRLCNTRWRLFERDEQGWSLLHFPTEFRLREPSPLVGFPGRGLFLSTTPSTQPPGTEYGPCETVLLGFDFDRIDQPPVAEKPVWPGEPTFTDHSYRGVSADGEKGEILWMNIDAETSVQHWSFRNSEGVWSHQGGISFPVRSCYPQVVLKNRAAHVLAIGDIVEPIAEWREYKHSQTGQAWDYVFRRLFYATTPDVTQGDFGTPLEVDSVESSAGHIANLDLWIGPDGAAHILYLKNNVQSPLMRDRFFPGLKLVRSLEYTVVREGSIVRRESLVVGGEGGGATDPHYGRFHATTDGRLWAIYSATSPGEQGPRLAQFAMQVHPEIRREEAVEIPLKKPFSAFFTAPERGGNRVTDTLDLFGHTTDGRVLDYAMVSLFGE